MEKERLAKGAIIEHLSDPTLGFATSIDTARSILSKLDSLYERQSLATQLTVEKRLIIFKFKEDIPLTKHFIIFDEMIVELQAAGETLKETSKISRLLLTLPTTYDLVVTAIGKIADDKLTLPFVKTRLLDYEIRLRNERHNMSEKVLQTEVQLQDKSQKQNKRNGKKFNNFIEQSLKVNRLINSHKYQNTNNLKGAKILRNISIIPIITIISVNTVDDEIMTRRAIIITRK